ncbi:hypothetical protein FVEN_g137 [Fusarium venenatum]|nr:hypothetical protein FVEN_g137 [Fusarium venenatum]
MVYFGKPSRGCGNCRNLHTKCDEGQPACSRCVKSAKTCDGYRDQSQLIFRDETAKTIGKDSQKKVLKHAQSTRAVSSFTSLGGFSAPFSNWHTSIPRTLCTSKEGIAISHFYNSTADNLPNGNPTRHLHQQLPSLYFRSQQGSVLRLAVEATSYACATKLIPQAIQLSSKCYIKALTALRTAIQDPNLRFSDETLYGILLLCGFETKTKQPSVRSAWGSHVDGAAALIKARGISDLDSSLFTDMFCFVRKSVVLGQIQISKPVDKVFLKQIMSSYEDTEDRLVSLTARVPQLQYTSCQLETAKDINTTEAEQLISDVNELDLELSIWVTSMSTKWSYATAVNINNHARIDYTPRVIHRYTDRYTARVWNLYRVSRLIVQSVLLRTIVCLSASTKRPSDEDRRNRIKRVIMGLVDDICASVPYLLGHDLSNMSLAVDNNDGRRIHDHGTSIATATSGTGVPIGGFSLIWPLSVACSALAVPAAQTEWMQRQLQLLTNHGEPLTSTILSGKPNEFRFDCV